jgi:hypothetical protein
MMNTQKDTQAAKLANSIQRLTEMLSDRLWNDPVYDGIKDRFTLLAMIDASNSAAKELEEILLEQ